MDALILPDAECKFEPETLIEQSHNYFNSRGILKQTADKECCKLNLSFYLHVFT